MKNSFLTKALLTGLMASSVWAGPMDKPLLPTAKYDAIFFEDKVEVELNQSENPNRILRYTLNGTEPDFQSPAYTHPIKLVEATDIRVAYFTKDGLKSKSITIPVRLNASVPKVDSKNLVPGLFTASSKGVFAKVPEKAELRIDKTFSCRSCELHKSFLGNDHFAIFYEGFIKIPKSGDYTFHLASDDGSILKIDNIEIINHDGLHGMDQVKTATVKLDAGYHAINLDYFEAEFDEGLELKITGAGLKNEFIPESWLFHKKGQTSFNVPKVTFKSKGKSNNLSKLIDNDFSTTADFKDVKKGDSVTVSYAELVEFNTVTFFSGVLGDGNVKRAVLQTSADGKTFKDYVEFYGGIAFKTRQKSHKAKAFRVLFKEDAGNVRLRELHYHTKAHSDEWLKSCVVNIDALESPDQQKWLEKGAAIAEESYKRIVERLPTKDFYLHRHVTFTVHPTLWAIAYAEWDKGIVRVDERHVKRVPNDYGLNIHEMAHIIQRYSAGESWVTEGIADYSRYWLFLDKGEKIPTIYREAKFTNGYGDAAHFLVWIQNKYDKDFIAKVNRHYRLNDIPSDMFKAYTGKTLNQLWKEFDKEFLSKQPSRNK